MRALFFQSFLRRCLPLGMALLLAGCGGGNSGGTGLAYTGVTTPAVIDFDNGQDLATGAFINGKSGGILGEALSVQQLDRGDHAPRTLLLAQLLDTMSADMQPVPAAADGFTAVTFANNRDGRCGGVRTYNIEADPLTGGPIAKTISASAVFCTSPASITA